MGDNIPNDNLFKDVIESIEDLNPNSDDCYKFTQNVRKQFVRMKLQNPDALDDPKQQSTLLMSLKDMDKQNTDLKRINVEEKNGANNALIQEIVAQMALRQPNGMIREIDENAALPEPDFSELDAVTFTEEELAPGLVVENSKEFISRMKDEGLA